MDHGQKCIRCPTSENLRCAGLDVRRYCELIDPSFPQYDPGYLQVIVREARRAWENADGRLAPDHHPGFGKPIIEGDEAVAIAPDCCGGGLPPGIFDEP